MNADTLRSILQSDFKLWEQATTKDEGGVVTKTLFLPYGIGEFTLTFTGVNKNAQTRRNAAGIWGQSIRDCVDDAIGDEAVTARAAQAAALASQDDGGDDRPRVTGPDDAAAEAVSAPQAVPTPSETAGSITATSNRLDGIRQQRDDYAKRIKGLDLEIKALSAYMEVMNAQEVPEETTCSPSTTDKGEANSSALPDGESESS